MKSEKEKAVVSSSNQYFQSDYMTFLLTEVDNFRAKLGSNSGDDISLDAALHLWIQQGHARKFRQDYRDRKRKFCVAHD